MIYHLLAGKVTHNVKLVVPLYGLLHDLISNRIQSSMTSTRLLGSSPEEKSDNRTKNNGRLARRHCAEAPVTAASAWGQ